MKFKKLYIVAATVLVVGGAGTGVALAMRPDAPKQQVADTSASLKAEEQPKEQPDATEAPATVESTSPAPAAQQEQDPEPEEVAPTASVEHTYSNNQGVVTVIINPGSVEPKKLSVYLLVQNGSNHIGSKAYSGSPLVFDYEYIPSGSELPDGVRVEITDQSGKVYTSEHQLN